MRIDSVKYPTEARKYLNENLPRCWVCDTPAQESEIIGSVNGFDRHDLLRIKTTKGYVEEFHHSTDWDEGPILHFGVRVYEDGQLVKTFI